MATQQPGSTHGTTQSGGIDVNSLLALQRFVNNQIDRRMDQRQQSAAEARANQQQTGLRVTTAVSQQGPGGQPHTVAACVATAITTGNVTQAQGHLSGGNSGPTLGCMPPSSWLANLPIITSAGSPALIVGTSNSASLGDGTPLPAETPLTQLIPLPLPSPTTEAIVLGACHPPIPKKIVEKAWRGEFIDLDSLLPSRLGTPEPTLWDWMTASQAKGRETKRIKNIEQWVICFNAYIGIMALRFPGRVADLLAYSSIIVNASRSYDDKPWLAYDIHFRKQAAAKNLGVWSTVDSSLWTIYFTNAKPKPLCRDCLEPGHTSCQQRSTSGQDSPRRGGQWDRPTDNRYQPYTASPICLRWNGDRGCPLPRCTYRHICLECHSKEHRAKDCPLRRGQNGEKGNQRFPNSFRSKY